MLWSCQAGHVFSEGWGESTEHFSSSEALPVKFRAVQTPPFRSMLCMHFGIRRTWIRSLLLPVTGSVTLEEELALPEPVLKYKWPFASSQRCADG